MKELLVILTILTTYNDKEFRTQCAMNVEASPEVANIIVDSIIADFRYNPEHLFDWAFQGAGKQNNDDKDAFLIDYKSTFYDPENNRGNAVLDIIVPGLAKFEDITFEGVTTDEYGTTDCNHAFSLDHLSPDSIKCWSRHFFIDAKYSGNFLKSAYGNLYIIPTNDSHTIYYMDLNIRFGWFFNIFISKRVYKNTMEWRIEQYIKNLKATAEQLELK